MPKTPSNSYASNIHLPTWPPVYHLVIASVSTEYHLGISRLLDVGNARGLLVRVAGTGKRKQRRKGGVHERKGECGGDGSGTIVVWLCVAGAFLSSGSQRNDTTRES